MSIHSFNKKKAALLTPLNSKRSACLHSRVTKKGVAREMQLHRTLVRKPSGSSYEERKAGWVFGACLGKEETSQEPVWLKTTQEVPDISPGPPVSHMGPLSPPFKMLWKSHDCTVSHTTVTAHKRCLHNWLVDFQSNPPHSPHKY